MKQLRYLLKLKLLLIALLTAMGCKTSQVIPDDVLIDIFHDSYLMNAYIGEQNIRPDSMLIYEPILERYGYTIEDVQYTIKSVSERKSAMISDIVAKTYTKLLEESKLEAQKVVILDTLDNIARRAFSRTIYADSLIRVNSLEDTTKLRITIDDIVPGEYSITYNYFIDSLDENRNSRTELYVITDDTLHVMRNTTMMSRYRDAKYSRKLTLDSTHQKIVINMFYHPQSEESKLPDITIRNFEVNRVLPAKTSVDSLYNSQLNLRIFNHELMSSFTADTVTHKQKASEQKVQAEKPKESKPTVQEPKASEPKERELKEREPKQSKPAAQEPKESKPVVKELKEREPRVRELKEREPRKKNG